MLHAVTDSTEQEEVTMMSEAVDHGGGHLIVGEYVAPAGEFEVGGDDEGAGLVGVGDDAEEELGAL